MFRKSRGWWAEAYEPDLGWALGDGQEHGNDSGLDAVDAEKLYELLEREVVPEFYTRDSNGILTAWVSRMRESMARLTPRFPANWAVREYTEKHYVPAAAAYHFRMANSGAVGRPIEYWQRNLEENWATIHIGVAKIDTRGEQHLFEVGGSV